MALQFRIHADKENPVLGSNGGTKTQQGGPTIRGKTFVDSRTPVAATPRKVLGLVNRNEASSVKTTQPLKPQSLQAGSSHAEKKKLFTPLRPDSRKSGDSKRLKFRQPLASQQGNQETTVRPTPKPQETVTCTGVCTSSAADDDDMEIDTVQPPSTQRDTYEDIIPVEEQASTFLAKLFKWPPPCLFGVQPESDEEEEEQKVDSREFIRKLDLLPKPQASLPEPKEEEMVNLDFLLEEENEVPLPNIDEESLSSLVNSVTLNDSAHLHSPAPLDCLASSGNTSACLDDSAPSPKLGSLQLREDF